jgi:hypothetical protein
MEVGMDERSRCRIPEAQTRAFTEAPILQHFDAEKPITLQTDASGFAIAGILNQFDGFGVLRPTSFYLWKCSPAVSSRCR